MRFSSGAAWGMTSHPAPTQFGKPVSFTDPRLSLAMAAYLARFKGQSRLHTDSDLRVFLRWCTARGLDPLTAQRHDVELYVRWLQETRRYKPSTVSRRTSVIKARAAFERTVLCAQPSSMAIVESGRSS